MGDPVLRAEHIAKSYRRHVVLADVSFAAPAGALIGIVGENGAGKSTLLKILAGELAPSDGHVTRSGALGYCPQEVILNDTLTVRQHVDYFRAAYRLTDERRAEEVMALLRFERYADTRVDALSGGTKQKLNLTLAVMRDPRVLLLDEPYQGFDWETYLRFWELAEDLRARGCSVLVISHLFFDQKRFDQLYRLAGGVVETVSA